MGSVQVEEDSFIDLGDLHYYAWCFHCSECYLHERMVDYSSKARGEIKELIAAKILQLDLKDINYSSKRIIHLNDY